jgi:acyl-coenzyme A synthetase/AMP-(fatty) acid ligase
MERYKSEIEQRFGRNAWPNLFDEKAKDPTSRPYAYLARSAEPQDGFQEVTYSAMANAINRAARWLVNELSNMLGEDEVFAYLGPSDLRYITLNLAAMKTGRRVSTTQ